jgi:hypothetical protein
VRGHAGEAVHFAFGDLARFAGQLGLLEPRDQLVALAALLVARRAPRSAQLSRRAPFVLDLAGRGRRRDLGDGSRASGSASACAGASTSCWASSSIFSAIGIVLL